MPNLNKVNYWNAILIIVWFSVVITGLVYFQLGQLKTFDSAKVFMQKSWFNDFKQQIVWDNKDTASLLLVTEESCGCFTQAKPHINSLTTFAKSKGLGVVQVQLTQQLKRVVPATPAAVIIDKHGQFVYAGPLSEGLACSQGSGFVETVITNLASGFNSELLITDTKGCYCTNNES
ncbi:MULTISPECIES: DUF6436 domain-containing protein [Pseudoalteromonas]|uniref:DUF6436 domain-containing protein n=1 Tax=Pseudoalteromonas fuliginea TaxID=1872678 RepID=A0ABD3Y806_9GAMM|nr:MULTISPECIES: DUF6436 domain-containing protein [Pseudoalteromonas]ALQ10095.1 hypothetical protein D172_018605 [Pseudoalteromonas sp. Bsw20308]ATG79753.1 hypothetical protein AOR04_19630 [Pseudoalteromonas sp. 1_2015MBL_MicDiv]KAA1164622.1 hypothetical protein EU509_01950 [Pseudoalteromonas fuliginea]KAA1169255.1 hypothetical protein EUZ79_02060 [Pseudoalteromonas fuliginea]KDC50047.1 hypothetical protein DC53_14170 [Pseudoalteromonas fuliginea]